MKKATLYVLPGSHPSWTARLMLEHKGIAYKRRDLIPVMSKAALKAARFPSVTVPALNMDGKRTQGSREIARELDRIQPEPALFPSDAEKRAAVEDAERWGDEVLQSLTRRILWNALKKESSSIRSYSEGPVMGIPVGIAAKTAGPIIAASARLNKATDETVKADLASLPEALDKVDKLIEDGVIGGEQPNAADFQIATSLRLLMTLDDLRPSMEQRPAGKLAMRLAPNFPGNTPPALPPEWLEPLRG